jgi:hypothetical protein
VTLKDEVLAALRAAGEAVRADLWHPDDAVVLELVAHDLVGLGGKVVTATDPAKLAQYKRSAALLVDHTKLLALRRAHVIEQDLEAGLEGIFLEKVLPALIALLPRMF